MGTANKDLQLDARTYFLQQGKSIGKLNDILDSNILTHHIGKWFSIILELCLYLLFSFLLLSIFILPTSTEVALPINDATAMSMQITNEDFTFFIILIKIAFIVICLPILAFAILLDRNRKRTALLEKPTKKVLK